MILVDSSVWIDYFNGRRTPETDYLDALLGNDVAATGDLILVEVLQGFRDDAELAAARDAMSRLPSFDLLGRERVDRAAGRYRALRAVGVTPRKTVDVVIGSFCACAARSRPCSRSPSAASPRSGGRPRG